MSKYRDIILPENPRRSSVRIFACVQTNQCFPLFHFALNRGPRV